ncbi:hypothetical protein U1Q18_036833 [Sarracenia purpurea var. burkii]
MSSIVGCFAFGLFCCGGLQPCRVGWVGWGSGWAFSWASHGAGGQSGLGGLRVQWQHWAGGLGGLEGWCIVALFTIRSDLLSQGEPHSVYCYIRSAAAAAVMDHIWMNCCSMGALLLQKLFAWSGVVEELKAICHIPRWDCGDMVPL